MDVASGYTWAELHGSERNPRSRHCQALLHRLAYELALAGWKLQTVTTDNGSEFTNQASGKVVEAVGAKQRRIRAGRPTSNGCVERVLLTILEECWLASFARSLVPKLTALRRDIDEYSTTTTPTGPTPAVTPKTVSPSTSSTVPENGSPTVTARRVYPGLAQASARAGYRSRC